MFHSYLSYDLTSKVNMLRPWIQVWFQLTQTLNVWYIYRHLVDCMVNKLGFIIHWSYGISRSQSKGGLTVNDFQDLEVLISKTKNTTADRNVNTNLYLHLAFTHPRLSFCNETWNCMYLSHIYIYIYIYIYISVQKTRPPQHQYTHTPPLLCLYTLVSSWSKKTNIENRGVCLKLLRLYGAFDCCHCVYLWWCTGLLLATQSGTSTGGIAVLGGEAPGKIYGIAGGWVGLMYA